MYKDVSMPTDQASKKKNFKDTLNLPRTDFPIRSNPKENDPKMIARWQQEGLYKKSFDLHKGKEKFVLHDGPPYANGHIHLGTAYNKILKDIICKSQRMFGKHVPVTPGWDCHGLPIELKVAKETPNLSRTDLKRACRAYAKKWIDIQRDEFKQLGVLMDWERPYLTMNFGYEASILHAFGIMVEHGYIERKSKTVPWCYSCQTVLAAAEIEYYERKDPSIYVLFPLDENTIKKALASLAGKSVSLVVWTTTPWTLPLNRAVLAKPQALYVVLDIDGKYIVIGKALTDQLMATMNIEKKVVAEISANELVAPGARAYHPFIDDLKVPVILDGSVLLGEGTAFVHCAPGAGPQDYEVGAKNNLQLYSPVNPDGTYTNNVEPKELAGMLVANAQGWVIKKLSENNKLLHKTSIRHSYPHCWRCRNGLIFRATKQWFCDLSRDNLKQKALDAIKKITMIPQASHKRFEATVEGRLEWCLSRQRVWGVPIPAFICTSCDYTYITKTLVDRVAKEVGKLGIEYWDTATTEILPKNFVCPNCNGNTFEKEQDILDVWFDSGVSHFAVLKNNPDLAFPSDIYLEGKDQHRGWFQSSLLTSVVIEQEPCMKAILTHGFTVDKKGHKMSKSLGNVVLPSQMIEQLGTDGLRLWVSSIDYADDAVVSNVLLHNVQEVLRKLRNTCRFLLSNLYDFDIENDAIAVTHMRVIDQYALQELFVVHYEVLDAYLKYNFTRVFHKFGDYCSVNLSSFYLDIVKDRLYVEKSDGQLRRSAQTACWYILDTLTRLIAPILSFTAEHVSDHYQKNKTESIHLQPFSDVINVWEFFGNKYAKDRSLINTVNTHRGNIFVALEAIEKLTFMAKQETLWRVIKDIRTAILKAIEEQREKQVIKHSLEAHVTVHFDPNAVFVDVLHDFFAEFDEIGENVESFFKEFLIVSQFDVVTSSKDLAPSIMIGLFVHVKHAEGAKCPRCWHWDITDNSDNLCSRCQRILKKGTK